MWVYPLLWRFLRLLSTWMAMLSTMYRGMAALDLRTRTLETGRIAASLSAITITRVL